MQSNRKTREGASHPDRDAQFEHINQTVTTAIMAKEPVVSVDTKKRELVGDFKAVGRELEPRGEPVEVRTHDFKDKDLGHAIPYGVYDLTADEGWVSVGITSDTATFACNTILDWWQSLGKTRYPNATTLTITADCGGSNSSRTAYGSSNSNASLTGPAYRSRSATSHPGRASGTRSSTGYSASSRPTGAASP